MPARAQKPRPKQEQFDQAEQQWDLERLYRDLAHVKGQHLTSGEMLHLRGLLCGHGPTQMGEKLYNEPHGVATNLSSGIYSHIKGLLGLKRIENWSRIPQYLAEAGYKKAPAFSLSESLGMGSPVEIKTTTGEIIINQYNQGGRQILNICIVQTTTKEEKVEEDGEE